MFNRKRKPPTRDELEHMALVKQLGCLCCRQLDPALGEDAAHVRYAEFNHHVGARGRLGADVGTGECPWHHRAVQLDGVDRATMLRRFGPSRKWPGSRPFHARFGSDAELLARQEQLLEQYASHA